MHIQFRELISTSPAQPDAGHQHLFSRVPAAAINPITLAIIVAFSTLVLPQTARATCSSSGVGTYVCEGENNAGIILNGTDIAVETRPGFGITEPGGAEPALSLIGSGAISYLDTNRSALDTTGTDSLYIQNDTSMTGQSTSINIQSNSSIGNGININNRSGADATIQIDLSGTLSGNLNGSAALSIHSSAEGNSAFTLNLDALSGSMGLQSYNDSRSGIVTTNINIANDINVEYSGASINNTGNGETSIISFNSKNIRTELDGLNVYNTNYSGAVITDINIDGDISSANSQAATFYNSAYDGPSSFRLRANHITGEYAGLYISNDSRNSSVITDILLTGDITSTSGAGFVFNSYVEGGDSGASIKLNNIYSYYEALSLSANTVNGDMRFDLDISGDIVNEYGTGILMMGGTSEGNSTIIINANNINSGSQSLSVNNYSYLGAAFSDITASGHLLSEHGQGAIINTTSNQGKATAVINLNDITAVGSSIEIYTAANEGDSTTDLTVTGQINASNGEGITLHALATDGSTLVNVDVNNIASEYDAIYLHNSVTGVDNDTSTIDLTTRGALVSQQGYGINIDTNIADTYVTVGGLVHGGGGTAIGIHRLDNIQKSATLELQSGYALEGATQALVFNGNYVDMNDAALDLANSHLVLGGTGAAAFDLGRIDNREEAILDGDSNRITGFGTLSKTNNSIWTLTGS
ncbi:beta strand repeat-containing protein, partial [Yersinia similis]|uniref:beta strand repeat-containing protein n=1 Tax=Yersinia similis TaxID=367190 RepID=UPI00066FC76E